MMKDIFTNYDMLSGYTRVAVCVPEIKVADVDFNIKSIADMAIQAAENKARITLFPELCVTAYTCADLFLQDLLLSKAEDALKMLAAETASTDTIIVVGAPLRHNGSLYNCAVVIYEGDIKGVVPKSNIPNYAEFYERRWFAPATVLEKGSTIRICNDSYPFGTDLLFDTGDTKFAIEICEDLWVAIPPSSGMAMAGADLILNLSATDETIGKHSYLLDLIRQQSARCRCGYVYASAGIGESSTDLVFSGNAIIAEDGSILKESPRFQRRSLMEIADIDVARLRNDRIKYNTFKTVDNDRITTRIIEIPAMGTSDYYPLKLLRYIDPHPFVPSDSDKLHNHCNDIISMQAWGLSQRLAATGMKKVVLGISGGLDSTLALLVTARSFSQLGLDPKGIIAITMPGLATTTRTHSNALRLMELLGTTSMEISINKAVSQHFEDIGQDPDTHDATYENSQARERTHILMDMANKVGGMVIGTGDLSELALGWCTYNGDQMSMYGVNASIPKTLVKYLVSHIASESDEEIRRVLEDIVDTPISPELVPAKEEDKIGQKTEDLVGPYELHDFFIYNMLRNSFTPQKIYALAYMAFEGKYSPETIKHWLKTFYRRFFNQQFKRSCMPDGPKVGSICLSPRGDWRMPSDASAVLWLNEVESI